MFFNYLLWRRWGKNILEYSENCCGVESNLFFVVKGLFVLFCYRYYNRFLLVYFIFISLSSTEV